MRGFTLKIEMIKDKMMNRITITLSIIIIFISSLMAADYDQTQKIVATTRYIGDAFGNSVSISGDYAIVGAPEHSWDVLGLNYKASAGAAYIYKWNGSMWVQEVKLVAMDRAESDKFAYSVDIDGDYAVIGAHAEDEDANGLNTMSGAGSVYVFKRNASTWTQQAKLVAGDRNNGDVFGTDVSISGDYIIVGASYEDDDVNGSNPLSAAGSAYIFKRDGSIWTQEAKLLAQDRESNDYFGHCVCIDGDYAIIGAHYEDDDINGENEKQAAGSAYIFKRSDVLWNQEAKLVALDRDAGDTFGGSVSISGDYAIVGALNDEDDALGASPLSFAGSAYIFKRSLTSWNQDIKLTASTRASYDYFGNAVSISGNFAIVAAYKEDEDFSESNTVSSAGSAYIFKLAGENWISEAKVVASDREENDFFASDVCITTERALVGAKYEDYLAVGGSVYDNAGAAYMYEIPAENASSISLVSFSAQVSRGKVELFWNTESETNNAKFILYRNDLAIAFIDGAGNSSEAHDYFFCDNQVKPGVSYEYILADVDYSNMETRYANEAVVIMMSENTMIKELSLAQNYPNPFNPVTAISYQLPTTSNVVLNVYDLNGYIVKTLVSATQEAGAYMVKFNAASLTSGMYIYRMTAGNEVITKKMVLMK